MKICFISSYPPDKEGVGEYTKRIIDHFPNKNIDISIITFKSKETSVLKNVYRELSWSISSLVKSYKTLKNLQPDIIHVQYAIPIFKLFSFPLWTILAIYKKNNKCKIVATFHEIGRELYFTNVFGKIYYNFISKLLDKIFVLTKESKIQLINDCGIDNNKIQIIPHGVYRFQKKINRTRIIQKSFNLFKSNIILYFGYIHIDKGLKFLIEALNILNKKDVVEKKKLILVVAGSVRPRSGIFRIFEFIDQLYLKSLKLLINKYHLNTKVRFTGYIEDIDIYSWFKISKIICLPYTKVEQSGVLNLALINNRPIVASRLKGLEDTLKDAGELVPPRDPKAISLKITKLISNPDYYRQIIRNYKLIIKKQNPFVISKFHLKLYSLL